MKALIGSLVLLHTFSAQTFADVCVYKSVKVSAIYGRVISHGKNPDDPIPQANVKLLEYRNGQWLTKAEVTTDDDGRFSFRSVGRGTYHLRVGGFALSTIEAEVRLDRSSPPKRIDREIIIGMEPQGCGNVFVRKMRTGK